MIAQCPYVRRNGRGWYLACHLKAGHPGVKHGTPDWLTSEKWTIPCTKLSIVHRGRKDGKTPTC
jgi:hypothetical protein